jgi:hypothetical protein
MLRPDDHIAQLEHVVRTQMAAIDKLRDEVAQIEAENRRLLGWIMGDAPDALLALQKVYSNPRTTEPNVIKAASAALSYERPKPASQTNVTFSLLNYLEKRRLADLEAKAKVVEHAPAGSILGHDGGPEPAA